VAACAQGSKAQELLRAHPHFTGFYAQPGIAEVAEQFTQWRQSRPSVRGSRIPAPLWTEVLALVEVFAVPRVATALHRKPQALNRRCRAPVSPPLAAPGAFVEVAPPAWRACTAEVEVQRPDGTRFRITYSEAAPALAPLLQTFLEAR
jgi:hypothetical protein